MEKGATLSWNESILQHNKFKSITKKNQNEGNNVFVDFKDMNLNTDLYNKDLTRSSRNSSGQLSKSSIDVGAYADSPPQNHNSIMKKAATIETSGYRSTDQK